MSGGALPEPTNGQREPEKGTGYFSRVGLGGRPRGRRVECRPSILAVCETQSGAPGIVPQDGMTWQGKVACPLFLPPFSCPGNLPFGISTGKAG